MSEHPLRAMLREKGFATRHEQDVQLWIMFHALFMQMREIALQLEADQ